MGVAATGFSHFYRTIPCERVETLPQKVQVTTAIQKIKQFVIYIFQKIVEAFQRVYRFITNAKVTKLPTTCTYHVSYWMKQREKTAATNLKPKFLLSCDGGGVRGVADLAMLSVIEEKIGCKIGTAFDRRVGSSTGGIIAGALSLPVQAGSQEPRYWAKEVLQLYFTMAVDVFVRPIIYTVLSLFGLIGPKYPNDQAVFKQIIGDKINMKDCVPGVGITAYDLRSQKLIWFSDKETDFSDLMMKHNINVTSGPTNTPLYEVGEATSAAPTYFDPKVIGDMECVDGGVAVNNPAQIGTLQALKEEPEGTPLIVFSVGTGVKKQTGPKPLQGGGLVQWIPTIVDTLLDAGASVAEAELLLTAAIHKNVSVIRLQPVLETDGEMQMDNADPANLQNLYNIGVNVITDFLNQPVGQEFLSQLNLKVQHS